MTLVAAAMATGCVAEGDFGRKEPSGLSTRLGLNAYAHVPGYQHAGDHTVALTGEEIDLRGHGYALAYDYAHEPTHDHWSEPERHIGLLHSADKFPNAAKYAERLTKPQFRSPEARANAIVDDIRADLAHIDAFEFAALKVNETDGVRLVDLERLPTSERTATDVARRIAENRAIIEQTLVALFEKIAGYELALGDAVVAGAGRARVAGSMELEGIRRRAARLEAVLRQSDSRVAMTLPREPECLQRSIANPC